MTEAEAEPEVAGPDDRFVTTFYDPMTPSHAALTPAPPGFDTTRVGEAMASAPGSKHSPVDGNLVPASRRIFRRFFRRRRKIRRLGRGLRHLSLTLALLLLPACGDAGSRPTVGPPLAGPVAGALADPSRDVGTPSPGATAFYQGLLADTLAGDAEGAGAGYARALDDPTLAASLATRAALRWAAIEATAGRTRRSIELVARASALAEGDPVLTDSADRLQGAIASLGPTEVEVRGPPLGTAIPGLDPATAARLGHAEALLARAHRLRLRPVIEALSSSIRAKEKATEAAVRAFREVATDGPAAIAADFRIGSLYHDLAIALVFELPPELDPGVASRLRRTLRASALGYLRKAVPAYRRALEPANGSGAELWRAAAQSDLRGALDLLGER